MKTATIAELIHDNAIVEDGPIVYRTAFADCPKCRKRFAAREFGPDNQFMAHQIAQRCCDPAGTQEEIQFG
jgi:hypothetical protein